LNEAASIDNYPAEARPSQYISGERALAIASQR